MRAIALLTMLAASPASAAQLMRCTSPLVWCYDGCYDLRTDSARCGDCAKPCGPGQLCSASTCVYTCGDGFATCATGCADVRNDPRNCGACGAACGPSQLCEGGACVDVCAPLSVCESACVDVQHDPTNCGGCGIACGPDATCDGGACRKLTCAARTGGGFVTFSICGQSVKLWVTSSTFIDRAEAILGGAQPLVPMLEWRDGSDCDGEWTWHANPETPFFTEAAQEVCDGCPSAVEGWSGALRYYCPWSASVVAVERR